MKEQRIIVNGILEFNGRVLLAKRASTKKIAPGKWHLPGGHVEFREEPEQALIREFKEELDLDVLVGDIIRTFSYTIGEIHTVGISFAVFTKDNLDNIKFYSADTEELAWAKIDELSRYPSLEKLNTATIEKYFEKTR